MWYAMTRRLNDQRPKLMKLLLDASIGTIIVEHKDRLTRFGFNYIDQLLVMQGRKLEVIFPSDTDNELVDDFVSVITSMCSRISGKRNSKRVASQVKKCIEKAMEKLDEDGTGIENRIGLEQCSNHRVSQTCWMCSFCIQLETLALHVRICGW